MRIIIGVGIQTMRLIIGPTNRGCPLRHLRGLAPPTTPHWRADALGDSYADALHYSYASAQCVRLIHPSSGGWGVSPPQ